MVVGRRLVVLLVAALAVAGPLGAAAWRVGVGSRTILPPVNGTTDYLQVIPDEDANDPGVFVEKWDFGRISVGNGDIRSHWVRDDLRTQAAAIAGDDGNILIFSSTEVYMLFAPDLAEYYERVRDLVGEETYARLRFLAHGQHNHEGPDTSGLGGPVNREYQEYMYDQMAAATLDALNSLEPAELKFGQFEHNFGLGDGRDPRIVDNVVHVLRAYPISGGKPIATIVQWGMHPEVTLGFRPTVPYEDCEVLGIPAEECTARGRFFTGDYPGILRRILKEADGSREVIYYNGAIGSQIGPRGPVWEITDEHPIGDGTTPPEGAVVIEEDNFRKAFLIGQQLGLAVAASSTPYTIPAGSIEYTSIFEFSRLTNPLFRIGLCPQSVLPRGDPTIPAVLGYNLRDLYICSEPANEENCVFDNYEFEMTPLPMRKGNFARIELRWARLGPVQFITVPGEMSPELSIGVPRDFDTPEGVSKYFVYPELHPTGVDYYFPGTVHSMLNCSVEAPCFMLGLTGDEMGYMLPISDWYLTCLGDDADCLADYEKGAMDYENAMAGTTCETIIVDVEGAIARYTELYGEETALRVVNACRYGQVTYDSSQHYEETNSGGWNGVDDYFKALSKMMGVPLSGRYQDE